MSVTVDVAELRALVERIAVSSPFRNSPRIREFLLFVTDRALSNHLDEITEQQIGHGVFRRAADYDTANDNIVRVSARQLRHKLRDYFDDEGRHESVVIEIPKGGYIPHFLPRQAIAAPQAEPPVSPDIDDEAGPRTGRPWKLAAIAFALTTAVLAILLLVRSRDGAMPVTPQPILADLILPPGQRTLMVLPDSGLVLLQQLTGRSVTTDQYANHKYEPDTLAEVPADVLTFLRRQQLTSAANIGLAVRLLRLRPEASSRIAVYHARGISARDLKEASALLLGGPRANPWAALFEDQLNFRFDFGGGRQRARIVNHQPRENEPREFDAPTVDKGFARIALVPNIAKTGKILLIGGTTAEATEAAAEFLFEPASVATLQKAFGVNELSALHSFEVLLGTEAVGGTARASKVITFRLQQP